MESDGFIADESSQSLAEMPSVRNLKQPNSTDIVKLIEEIEKRNHLIVESSKPTVAIRKRSVKKKEMKSSNTQKEKTHVRRVERKEAVIVEKLEPKLILKPMLDENNKTGGVVIYDREKHQCSNCNEKFPSQFLLKRHMAKSHPMECCDQVFKFNHDYKKRLANCPSKNAVTCAECNKTLKNKKTFQIHLKSHLTATERKFKCNWKNCTKSFNMKIHLENHLRMHKNEKCFPCPQCSVAFKQKHQVAIHVKQKH